ncbi:MAG: hypothetical protein JST89_04680 [Cyanobacteria bacterium SZAS-4]|nr:hypothetical protein [Cyanobacteria bacterium SZAS-4]
MPDTTNESAKPIETADSSLKKATTSEAAKEALNGLAQSSDPTQRAQEVSQATSVLVHNGDLPQLLLVFDGNENLGKLGMGDDQINKNDPKEMAALQSAAETGSFTDVDGNVVTLTAAEQIAAQALFENFDAIEKTGVDGAGDSIISTADINHAATDATAQAALGARYGDLESVVMAFPGLEDGSVDPAAFTKVFGKDAVSKTDIETLLRSPEFDNLTEQQQRGVLALYTQYDSIAGRDGDASSVTPDEVWGAAGEVGINFGGNKDSMAEQQAEIDAYEGSQSQTPVTGDTVDGIIRDLEKPMPSGLAVFDYLDSIDQNPDGSITQEQVHALATSPMLSLMDPKMAASIQTLDQNWHQLSGGKDTMTITDLAAQSTSYKDDATPEAIKAHAVEAAAPPTAGQVDDAMRAIYQSNPGTNTTVFDSLTAGQEGAAEDRKGFTKDDIDRTLEDYSSIYGADSPEYKAAQQSLGQIRSDFDKYDTNGDGAISYSEMKALSGDGRSVSELQANYGPADSATMSKLLAAGGDYSHQTGQKNLTQDELRTYISQLPADSPEKATLQYVLNHYDQIKAADGDAKTLTWNDIETFAGSDGSSASSGNSSNLKPGDKVPLGIGTGVVNEDGTVSYTIGEWTQEDQRETPNLLANTVLDMWGFEGPYSDELIKQTLAVIQTANPDVDILNYPTGVEITIPGEPPSSEEE